MKHVHMELSVPSGVKPRPLSGRVLFVGDPQRGARIEALLGTGGWTLERAGSVREAHQYLDADRPEVGILDLEAVNAEQCEQCDALLSSRGTEWVALLSASRLASEPTRELIARAFFDFHTLPLEPARLLPVLGHAAGMARLRKQARAGDDDMPCLASVSPTMTEVARKLRRAGRCDAPVLLSGETGTGKEVAAGALHRLSPRVEGPFVTVDCGSLPGELVSSELFGHERGAFTGAQSRRIGRIEAAHGGTLFLDEIGNLPLAQQKHLLRFLQEGTIQRIGKNEHIAVDARVVAATHVDLERAVEEGEFREDLLYRLNVLQITMPPLRDRREDIEPLARRFFEQAAAGGAPVVRGFSGEALRAMRVHHWPGNVRELRNRIERAVVMSEHRLIRARDLGLEGCAVPDEVPSLEKAREVAEREALQRALTLTRNHRIQAAELLGISRITLYRLLRKHELGA